jgi:hypothetical protein
MRQSQHKKEKKEITNVSSSHRIIPKLYTSLGSAKGISSAKISGAVQYNQPKNVNKQSSIPFSLSQNNKE